MNALAKTGWMCAAAAAIAVALLAGGCADDQRNLANTLYLSQADEALSRVREDAAKYAPELLAPVEEQMSAAKTSLAIGRHKQVERDLQKLGPDLEHLIAVTKERRDTAEAELARAAGVWNAIADVVPQQIETLEARFAKAKRSGKRPAGMSAKKFEELEMQFAGMKATWAQADDAVTNSQATQAATLGQQAKDQGDALLQQLK